MMPDRAKSPGQSTDVDCPVFLSPRETQTLTLAAYGHTDEEIGRRLGLVARTVRQYLHSAYRKLDASNRTHAVAIALVYRLIDLDTQFLICTVGMTREAGGR